MKMTSYLRQVLDYVAQKAQLPQRKRDNVACVASQKMGCYSARKSVNDLQVVVTSSRGHVVHGFKDKITQRPKNRWFHTPNCHLSPHYAVTPANLCTIFTSLKCIGISFISTWERLFLCFLWQFCCHKWGGQICPDPTLWYFIFFRLPRISRKSSDTDTV